MSLVSHRPTAQVIDAIRSAGATRTVIVVSHDPLVVEYADRVVRLESGVATMNTEEPVR